MAIRAILFFMLLFLQVILLRNKLKQMLIGVEGTRLLFRNSEAPVDGDPASAKHSPEEAQEAAHGKRVAETEINPGTNANYLKSNKE